MAFKHFQLRSRAGFMKYLSIELQLLKKEWKILLPCVIMQCTSHSLSLCDTYACLCTVYPYSHVRTRACLTAADVHGVFHNLAYWVQGSQLSKIQRYPLYDLGFELMSELRYAYGVICMRCVASS